MEHHVYKIILQMQLQRDGRQWLARCPAIAVTTQSPTKKEAKKQLREAVEGWFEYCIEEGALDQALKEAGFNEISPTYPGFSDFPNRIIKEIFKEKDVPSSPRFTLTHDKWSNDYVQGLIPLASLVSSQLQGEALTRV